MFSEVSSIWELDPFRAPEPLRILNPSNFVPKNGFPAVKGLRHSPQKLILEKTKTSAVYIPDEKIPWPLRYTTRTMSAKRKKWRICDDSGSRNLVIPTILGQGTVIPTILGQGTVIPTILGQGTVIPTILG